MQPLYDQNHLFTVILIGNGVGKTALLTQFTDRTFPTYSNPIIGSNFKIATINENQENFQLKIWDTAENSRFRAISSAY